MLQIKRMPVGQIGTNCYLLEDTDAKLCAVIDPGDQPEDIDREIRKAGLTLTMILITHGHFDHVLGVPGLLEKWPGIPVYVHEKEVNWAGAGDQYMLLAPVEGIHTVKEGDTIPFGGATIQVLHTPGHSPGSVTYRVSLPITGVLNGVHPWSIEHPTLYTLTVQLIRPGSAGLPV